VPSLCAPHLTATTTPPQHNPPTRTGGVPVGAGVWDGVWHG